MKVLKKARGIFTCCLPRHDEDAYLQASHRPERSRSWLARPSCGPEYQPGAQTKDASIQNVSQKCACQECPASGRDSRWVHVLVVV